MAKRQYRQGKYSPQNPKKYLGDPTTIVYRSSWERILFSYLDSHDNCIGWNSEEVVIPYRSPVDDRMHRYFVDVKAIFKLTDGTKKTFLIEIKPFAETQIPTSKNKRVLMEQVATYQINQAKWAAARKFCKESGFEFLILTEYDIGLKKRG